MRGDLGHSYFFNLPVTSLIFDRLPATLLLLATSLTFAVLIGTTLGVVAMTLALHERKVFTWPEWAQALGAEIKRAQAAGDPDTGETYYRHWLAALERIVAEKGVTDSATLSRYVHAWDHAADRTPHGQPIVLKPEDFR